MDVADAIDGEAVLVTHAATRAAGGEYVDGKWVAATPATAQIYATIQPLQGRAYEKIDLPEGVRDRAQWLLWSRVNVQNEDHIITTLGSYRVLFTWPRPADGFTRCALELLR